MGVSQSKNSPRTRLKHYSRRKRCIGHVAEQDHGQVVHFFDLFTLPRQHNLGVQIRNTTLSLRGLPIQGLPTPRGFHKGCCVSTRGAVSVAFHGSGFAFRLLRPIGLSGFGFKGFKVKGFRV